MRLQLFRLLRRRHLQERRQRLAVHFGATRHRLGDAAEIGEKLIVFLLRDRIVLVAMAFGAAQRQAEPDLAERVGAVDVVADDVFLGIHASFLVEARVAIKSRCDLLLDRRVWQ